MAEEKTTSMCWNIHLGFRLHVEPFSYFKKYVIITTKYSFPSWNKDKRNSLTFLHLSYFTYNGIYFARLTDRCHFKSCSDFRLYSPRFDSLPSLRVKSVEGLSNLLEIHFEFKRTIDTSIVRFRFVFLPANSKQKK